MNPSFAKIYHQEPRVFYHYDNDMKRLQFLRKLSSRPNILLVKAVYTILNNQSKRRIRRIIPVYLLLALMDLLGVVLLASCGTIAFNLVSGDTRPSRVELILRGLIPFEVASSTLILTFAISAAVFLIAKTTLSAIVNFRMIRWLASQESQFSINLFDSLLKAPLAEIRKIGIGDAQWAIMIGSSRIVSGVVAPLIMVLGDIISILVLLATLLTATPFVTLVLIALLIMSQRVYSYWLRGKLNSYGHQTADKGSRLNEEIMQSFNAVKEIKIYSMSEKISKFFASERNIISSIGQKSSFLNSLFRYYLESIILFSAFFVVVFELYNSDLRRALTSLVLFMSVGLRIIPSLQRLQAITMSLQLSQGMTKNFFALNKQLSTLTSEASKIHNDFNTKQSSGIGIELENVCYSVNLEFQKQQILTNISARIEPGDFTAIIGTSGSGKTTLVDLISTLIDTSSGSINYFDEGGNSLPISRKQIAYCAQSPYVFDTSIEDNLAISMSEFNLEKVNKIINYFDLNSLLAHSPNDNSISLSRRVSGGERQRIGLARVFLSGRPISIFDEPTSALDKENMAKFLELLNANRGNTTQIVVTHDHEIAKKADRLMVIEKGNLEYFGVPHLYFARPSTVHE
jgi:ABC-type multidrug transport system fused ATPase/permease subunit